MKRWSLAAVALVCAWALARCDFDGAARQCLASGHCQSIDAGSDSGAAADGGPDGGPRDAGSWCQQHAPDGSVCFDYDEPDAGVVNPQLACVIGGTGCSLTFAAMPDTDSPPDALVASLPRLGAYPDYASAKNVYSWLGGLGTAIIAFDVRIDVDAGSILAALDWNEVLYDISYAREGITVREASYRADSGIAAQRYDAVFPDGGPDLTLWHRLVLTVSPGTNKVTFDLDGVEVIHDTTRGTPLGGQVAFEWGISYVNGPFAGSTAFHFDNVVLIGEP